MRGNPEELQASNGKCRPNPFNSLTVRQARSKARRHPIGAVFGDVGV